MSSDETARRFRAVAATLGAEGLNDSRNERETREVIRFVVVESAQGYVFGLVTFAPSSLSLRAVDWARKPRHFSAGTRAEIGSRASTSPSPTIPAPTTSPTARASSSIRVVDRER